MQKQVKPKVYKIAYTKCKKGGLHNGEPLNIVCLDSKCSEHMLICSICKSEEHDKHKTQPLKIYIDQLSTSFGVDSGVQKQLNELEERKNQILVVLQQTVIQISNKFKDLEYEILKRFRAAREKILQIDGLKKGFQGIHDILSTPNHPDLIATINKYTNNPSFPTLPIVERLSSLEGGVIQQINSAISFYADESSKFESVAPLKVLCPTGISFDGQIIEQVVGNNTLNLCLLNEPITLQNNKVKIKILSDNIKMAFGMISMAQFKKYQFVFNPAKASSNFIYWISSQNKGINYNSNTITSFANGDVFDLSFKKNQLVINKKKLKQFASFIVKDLGVDWYYFIALIGPGKVQIMDKWGNKK